jgi:sulfonate transport system substrate-binding protein
MTVHAPRRALALLAAPLVTLAACGSGDRSEPAASSPVTSAATPASSSTAAADLSGVTLRVGDQVKITESGLKAAGQDAPPYKIEWSSFTSGPPMLEALAADAIDIGGVGDAPPIFAAAGGAKIKVVLATKTPQVNQGVIVKGDSAISDVAGLKGKKVAVAKGSSANWILLKALQDNGLTVSDVDVAYLQPTDAQQAFTNGSVDAWVVWDPFASLAESQGGRLIISGDQLGIPGLGFQVASDKALGDPAKQAAIRDYLQRVRAAQAWQRDHKEAWATTYSQLTKLPPELTAKLLQVDSQPTAIDAAVIHAQQAEADAFFAAGLIPNRVDFAAVADTRFNDIDA